MGEREFEIGARLRFVDGRGEWVIAGVDHRCLGLTRDHDLRTAYTIDEALEKADRIAPAPKHGQRWCTSGGHMVDITEDVIGRLMACDTNYGRAFGWSDAMTTATMACWLLDNGYNYVAESARAEIREGMRVRCDQMKSTGRVVRGRSSIDMAWTFDGKAEETHVSYEVTTVTRRIESGFWSIIDPGPSKPEPTYAVYARVARPAGDISALKPFFDLVAAIYTTPNRETSRRYVDMAAKALRGEPFAKAIQAVLVHATSEGRFERDAMSPYRIMHMIDGARAWERRRGEVAPGVRQLNPTQEAECWWAATVASGDRGWRGSSGDVYERARSAC